MSRTLAVSLCLFVLSACGKSDAPPATGSTTSGGGGTAPVAPVASPYLLATDPGDGISVLEAKEAAPKDEVVVVGRVRELLKGRAGFTLTDASVPYCAPTEECPTPWDYCCQVAAAAKGTILVRVRAGGRTVVIDKLPELRNLDLVAVKGRLLKEGEDVVVDATGWYARERPKLDWDIDWP